MIHSRWRGKTVFAVNLAPDLERMGVLTHAEVLDEIARLKQKAGKPL